MAEPIFRATRGPGAHLPNGAAQVPADSIAWAARAADARFIGEATIIAAAAPIGAAHPATAIGAGATARLAARPCRETAALCGALLPGGTAPTLALTVWRAARAIHAAVSLRATRGPAGAVAGAAGVTGAALTQWAAQSGARAVRGTTAGVQA